MIKITILSTLLCSLCLIAGCGDGGAGEAILKRRSNLQRLGSAYLAFHQANGKSAANTAELTGFMADSTDDLETTNAITSLDEGDIVMIFNGELGADGGDANYVLGFEAGVPATGGYVVMADGTVRLMTVKDFVEAPLLSTPIDTE